MSTARRRAALSALVAGVLVAVSHTGATGQPRREGFPHAKHASVSPTCTGCHSGIRTADSSTQFPALATCQACHDGVQQDSVRWRSREAHPSLLRFNHLTHQRSAKGEATRCQECHARRGDTAWMRVDRASPDGCVGCHAHRATRHLADDQPCVSCHVALTDAPRIPLARVAQFPTPPSHDRPDFASSHRPDSIRGIASCATCHARESCARCHVNAATLVPAQQLATDGRIRTIVATKLPRYPLPETHRAAGFTTEHGGLAKQHTARCANCHAQPACKSCHIGTLGTREIATLPSGADRAAAVGVRLQLERATATPRPFDDVFPPVVPRAIPIRPIANVMQSPPPQPPRRGEKVALSTRAASDTGVRRVRMHPLGFDQEHGGAAASGELRCQGCHERRWCADCHGGEAKRRYHQANFVARHAPEAYGVQRDCAQCHNAEVFCRGCHVQTGLGTRGRLDEAFHTAQPLWLLQHGRAARSSLETCTTCHTQRECMQCHSGLGLRVNPHGRDFNATRMATKNRDMCFTCHLTDPLRGR
jgi:hypothetical protein